MTFTSTSRADWQAQAHSAGTRRSPGWTLADEREARTAREEEMTTAAHPQTARRRPGAQESQGSPGKPRTTCRGVLGTLPSRRDTPPPARGASRGLVATWPRLPFIPRVTAGLEVAILDPRLEGGACGHRNVPCGCFS